MASATAASSLASASSSFFTGGQQLKAEKNVSHIYGRFNFGGLKKKGKTTAAPKPKPKPKESTRRPMWLPGAKAPEWMDGSLVGDYGFDPLALGKPLEYLQYLDQNLDQNLPGDLLGNFARDPNIKPAIQPYSDVFGLQRFRECELIHGHWAVLGVLGALALEGFTGVYWKDVGKANRSWIKIQRWKQSILAAVHYLHEEQGYGEWLQEMMELYHSHSLDDGESQFMKCSSVVVQRVEAPVSFVWSLVRRFDEPQIYKQFVSSCFIHGEGDLKAVKAGYLREVRVVSGLPAATSTERLDILDEEWHIMSFSIVGGDHWLSNY